MRHLGIACLMLVLGCSSDAGDDADTGPVSASGDTSGGSDDFAPFVLRCDPNADNPCAQYGNVACCSDDPAAMMLFDGAALEEDALPSYEGGSNSGGTPIFSAGNNPLSRSGYCLAQGSPPQVSLVDLNAEGCRTPCNPTWSSEDIATICGPSAQCCQTVELAPQDCVLDPNLGGAGCFRPVTGHDITGLGGIDATNWSSTSHVTHQDPSGLNCEVFASGLPLDYDINQVLVECYRRLTVADQRGSCFQTTELAECPFADPDYVDACEQMNIDMGLPGCD
jgi:hypothetical protein